MFYTEIWLSLICIIYIISFVFYDESDAQKKILIIHYFEGVLGSSIIVVLRGFEKIIKLSFCEISSFCFALGYNSTFNKAYIYEVDSKGK